MNEKLDFLKWFFINTDFGPADSDVKIHMMQEYERETGNRVPEGYREGYLDVE